MASTACRAIRISRGWHACWMSSSVEPLELVGVDNHRLVLRRGGPFLHRWQGGDRLAICVRLAFEIKAIGPEAADHRRVHRVGDGEWAEQEVSIALAVVG